MFDEIFEVAFNDELEKIAAKKEIDPGHLKGLGGAMRAYYTDKPLSNIGEVMKEQGKGLLVGAPSGAAAGAVGALILKALKKGGKVGRAAAIGSGVGAGLGAIAGTTVGGTKGFQKIFKKKGITMHRTYTWPKYTFSPSAAKKYKVA